MGSIAITGISGSMSDTRQGVTSNRKLKEHYGNFLDEETLGFEEDDRVELSDEAQQMQQQG